MSGIGYFTADKFPKWKGNLPACALNIQRFGRSEIDEEHKIIHQEVLLKGAARMRDMRELDDGCLYLIYDVPDRIAKLSPVE